jgi:predicted ribosomally synthesized peptide with SipW-like signal peptide
VKRRLVLTALVLAGFAAVTVTGTYAAFSRTTASTSNQFTAGSLSMTDGHAAATAISITSLRPGTTISKCMNVTNAGDVASTVRQYTATSGSLLPYIQIKVTRGSGLSGAWPACTGFAADGTDYIGQGNGVVYNGTLASFPASYATATTDPTNASPDTWSSGESHAYQYDISLVNTTAAQGLTGSLTITWEARST